MNSPVLYRSLHQSAPTVKGRIAGLITFSNHSSGFFSTALAHRGRPLTRRSSLSLQRSIRAKTSKAQPTSQRNASTAFTSDAVRSMDVSGGSVVQTFSEAVRNTLLKPRTVPVPRWVTPKHYSVTFSEVFGHSSFILVAISYAVDDFLMLRIIAVAGSSAMLFFTYFHPHGRVLWLPFKWNILFIAINSYRIGKILMHQYQAELLSEDMLRIRQEHFQMLDLVDFKTLLELGREETFEPGVLVLGQGCMNRNVRLVIDGKLDVLRDGKVTYTLEEGNFVSEAGIHAGLLLTGPIEASGAIVARGDKPVRVLSWERTQLVDLLHRNTSLMRSLKAALSCDIICKLKGQRQLLISPEVDEPQKWTIKRNEQNEFRYEAILHNILTHPDSLRNQKEALNMYRKIHHIDDHHHKLALAHCGWTSEEFEAGYKEGAEEVYDEELKRDWKWWASTLLGRVF